MTERGIAASKCLGQANPKVEGVMKRYVVQWESDWLRVRRDAYGSSCGRD